MSLAFFLTLLCGYTFSKRSIPNSHTQSWSEARLKLSDVKSNPNNMQTGSVDMMQLQCEIAQQCITDSMQYLSMKEGV